MIPRERLSRTVGTFATCWIVRLGDGAVLGFTDHDRELEVAGVSCLATSGLEPAEAVTSLGLGSDAQDVAGVLDADVIRADEIAAGRFDGALVETWSVDWREPAFAEHRRTMEIGEIVREDGRFRAELRGLSNRLDRASLRRLSRSCDADLGDPRCGVELDDPRYRTHGTVLEAEAVLRCSGIEGFADGWFTHGRLTWTGGANADTRVDVAFHEGDALSLWEEPARTVAAGDTFRLDAGCDKRFETCRERFANVLNFRGFPHMPGQDFAFGYVTSDAAHDGAALIE